jgi:hypothetical protein
MLPAQTVRTISFKLLYGLVILRHARRRLARIAVTTNPTAEWIAGQVTEAFPWSEAPRHLIRDRDRAFGSVYTRRVHAMGIRDHPTAARSPWQNGHVEWLIGSGRARMGTNASSMPAQHSLWLDDDYGIHYRREKPGQPDQDRAIDIP